MSSAVVTAMISSFPIFLLAKLRQDEPVLDTTAALKHIFVIGVRISFADNVRTSKLELWRQGGFAGPFDISVAV